MIRILLAEDQTLLRGALAALLALESDLEIVGSAADGEAAWRELQRLKPDLLVTDIEMPGLSGLELAQRIQRHELRYKVVIVTTFARSGFLRRALEAGVSGYLLKDAPAEDLAEALRKVHRGGRATAFRPRHCASVFSTLRRGSPRCGKSRALPIARPPPRRCWCRWSSARVA